jgi:hypothetical protein
VPVSALTKSKDLTSLRRMLARPPRVCRPNRADRRRLMALLSRVPADHPVDVSAADLGALAQAGDEQRAE